MPLNLGLLCSNAGLEMAAVVRAVAAGGIPAAVGIAISDCQSSALIAPRSAGFQGILIPRAPFHANRDGYERRLVQILTQAEVRLVVLAGYEREPGPVLTAAFPIFGQGLGPEELVARLTEKVRANLLTLVGAPGERS